jgi:hypothetical protein
MTLDSKHTKKTLEALSENIIGKVYFFRAQIKVALKRISVN